jgi:hypothetical protein
VCDFNNKIIKKTKGGSSMKVSDLAIEEFKELIGQVVE